MNIFGIHFGNNDVWFLGIAIGLFMALVGFHVNDTLNKKAIRRSMADSIASILIRQKNCIEVGTAVDRATLEGFSKYLYWHEPKKTYNERVSEYYAAISISIRQPHNNAPLVKAIDNLLKYTDRR